MGTGKTRSYLLAIYLSAMLLEQRMKAGEDVIFRPLLIVTPVAALTQTYLEAKRIFPDYNLYVYYGSSSSRTATGAAAITTSELIIIVCTMDPKLPRSGKTLIITLYITLSACIILRKYKLFRFKANREPPSVQRRKARQAKKAEKEAAKQRLAEDDDDPSPTPTKAKRQSKVSVYHRNNVNKDDIEFTKDKKIADGNLVWYRLKNQYIRKLYFAFLVCDKAYIAKKAEGVYNNLMRNLKWENLL
ncbi:hypothetical protein IL306_008460 [Fusarium sp. DS 682]|nr:hypothetical protein IL306_008460 [Fusarium sp. DS 682]